MTLQEMIDLINLSTDENFTNEEVLSFMNQAIAKVNSECQADFPYITQTQVDADETYEGFEEVWQRMLIVPYASGKIKQNDASQFEYTDFYIMFDNNLSNFKANYDIPDEYALNESGSVKFINFNNSPWAWNVSKDGSDPLDG